MSVVLPSPDSPALRKAHQLPIQLVWLQDVQGNCEGGRKAVHGHG